MSHSTAFYLPLLVGCGLFVSALVVVFVKLARLVRSEGCVVVALEDARFEPTSSEETEDKFEVIEESVFVDGVAEEVFTAGVSERDELFVPFYALWVDGANVVVADAFADRPLVIAWIGGVGLLDVLGVDDW
jgi:hypothetical protein